MSNPKPCPFCGAEASVEGKHFWPGGDGEFFVIAVDHAEACYMADDDAPWYSDPAALVEDWNQRKGGVIR